MRCADVDSPLMVQAFDELGEDGVAEANAAFSGLAMPGYPNFGANQVVFLTRAQPRSGWRISGRTTSRPSRRRRSAPSWPTNRPG